MVFFFFYLNVQPFNFILFSLLRIVALFIFHTIRYMAVYLETRKHDSAPLMQTMNYQLQKEKEIHGVAVQLLIFDRFFPETKLEGHF